MKKMKRSRLIQKNGEINVSQINVAKKERQFLRYVPKKKKRVNTVLFNVFI